MFDSSLILEWVKQWKNKALAFEMGDVIRVVPSVLWNHTKKI
jgi:hypothetical protein